MGINVVYVIEVGEISDFGNFRSFGVIGVNARLDAARQFCINRGEVFISEMSDFSRKLYVYKKVNENYAHRIQEFPFHE